jgi:ABC-type nickel/cobalt efflux system permease component RcnA
MAAYLVGERGSMRHAAALAGSVTLTHTVGVLALGIALSISVSFAPAAVYPVLGVVSGLLMVGIGLTLLMRAWRARVQRSSATAEPHQHSDHLEGSGHHHHHGGRVHTHAPATVDRPRLRGVLAIGFVGGMVPSPSALVVLIGGIALHRTWFALLLVVVYGLGMALALTGTGVALRHVRAVMDRRLAARRSQRSGAWWARVSAAVPITAAAAVILVGVGLTLRGSSGL